MTTPPLGDGRLVLEPLRVDHAGEMVDVLSDAGLYAFTGGSPPSREELERRYAGQVAGPDRADEVWHNWVVRLGAGGPAVGYVQATLGPHDGVSELAWVVGTPWQGRGIARDAARLVLDRLPSLGVRRVLAHVHPDHVASQRVAASLGLRPTPVVVDGEVEWRLEDLSAGGAGQPAEGADGTTGGW
ncbi:MAG: GNAT family N-acetyltransferase [Ornithinibacter sp.]